jgi:UDP-N-acetylmuramoylalanine--D-glutamate ligase
MTSNRTGTPVVVTASHTNANRQREQIVRLADLSGRSVAVWGTGREARAAVTAIAAMKPSRLLAVDDSADYADISWDAALAPLAAAEHAQAALVTADVVVRSPEVPSAHPWLTELRERGIVVTSGSALWMAERSGRTVAVTGGDRTAATAALISHLLTAAGRPNVLGEPGLPLLELPDSDLWVLALSGGQCAELGDSPRVAAVTAPAAEQADFGDQLNLLAYGPDLIVADAADERLMAQLANARDASGWAPIAVGTEDSRFRIDPDGSVYASDTRLFPRATLAEKGDRPGRDLCVALAVLDGMGVDVVDARAILEKAVAVFA